MFTTNLLKQEEEEEEEKDSDDSALGITLSHRQFSSVSTFPSLLPGAGAVLFPAISERLFFRPVPRSISRPLPSLHKRVKAPVSECGPQRICDESVGLASSLGYQIAR